MGIELGTAYVTVTASTKGVGAKVAKDFGDAGKHAGGAFSKAFGPGVKQAAADQERSVRDLTAAVDAGSQKVKAARKAEEDAARQVAIAEAKLAEVREPKKSAALERAEKALADLRKNSSGSTADIAEAEKKVNELREAAKPKASVLMAAEDRLAKAREKQATASTKAKAAQMELASTSDKLKKATDQAADASERSGSRITRAFRGLGAKIGNPFRGLSRQAADAGEDSGRAFAKQMKQETSKLSKGGKGGLLSGLMLGGALGGLAGAAGGALASGAGSLFGGSDTAAADLEQSIGAIDAIFKTSAKSMHEWSKQSSESVGLARNEYNELATVMGAQLKNGGTSVQELGTKTNELIKVGADLSSMFGGSTREAVEALSSALKGERDPIERYGVSLKQAAIDAKAAAMGFKDVKSGQAQQAATLALIMEQTKDAAGNFAREADTAAHKSQVLAAKQEDLKAKFGELILPMKTAATETGIRLVGAFDKFLPAIKRVIKPMQDARAMFGRWTQQVKDGWMFGVGVEGVANTPFTRLGESIAKVQAAWGNLKAGFRGEKVFAEAGSDAQRFADIGRGVRESFDSLLTWFKGTFWPGVKGVWDSFGGLLAVAQRIAGEFVTGMMARLAPLWPKVKGLFAQIGSTIGSAMELIKAVIQRVTAIIKGIWDRWGNQIMGTVKWAFDLVVGIVRAAMSIVQGIIKTVTGIIKGDWSLAWSGIKQIFSGIWNGIKQILSSVWGAIKGIWSTSLSFLKRQWSAGWGAIKSKASEIMESIRSKIEDVTGKFEGYFGSAVSSIGRAWDKVQETVRKPINFVIRTVLNEGIIKAFNKLASSLKIDFRLPRLSEVGAPSSSSGARRSRSAGRGSNIAMATGGVLPGYSPGRDNMHWFSPEHGRLSLSGGESILIPQFAKHLGAESVALLNQAAKRGRGALLSAFDAIGHQAFAGGGIVGLRGHSFTAEFAKRILWAEQMAGRQMSITQGGFRPRTSYSGTSHAGDALDIAGGGHQFFIPFLRSVGIPTWDRTGKGNWISHSHGVPLPFAGRAAGSAVWQAQDYLRGGDGLGGRDNGPRVPIRGADAGLLAKIGKGLQIAGGWAKTVLFDWASEFAGPLKQLASIGDSPVGQIGKAVVGRVVDGIKDKSMDILGFQSGGVVPRTGIAALSEDGRPELVVGPQFRHLQAGSRVFNYDDTRSMLTPRVYVQNPWTGEYMEARMVEVADDRIEDHQQAERRRAYA